MEEWKYLFGKYEVSSMGKIRNLKTKRNLKFYKANGYERIKLRDSQNTLKSYAVSRLVAEKFVENPNPEEKLWVDHKNRNRADNGSSNLRWVTARENSNNTVSSDRTLKKRQILVEKIIDLALNGKTKREIFKIIYGVYPDF